MAPKDKNIAVPDQKTLLQQAKKHLDTGGSYETLTQDQKTAIDAEYSFVTELIVNPANRELRDLFTRAVKGQWTAEYFKLQAENVKWFKDRSASQEWYDINTASKKNAVEMQKLRDGVKRYIREQAASLMGIDVNSAENDQKITAATEDILRMHYKDPRETGGWEAAVPGILKAKFSNVKATDLAGRYGAILTNVRGTIHNLGMKVDEKVLDEYGLQLLEGTMTQDTLEKRYRDQAAQMWSMFSDRIKAGENVKDIIYPYTQLMGSMLEVDPDSLDFTKDDNGIDPLLQKALYSSADGKSVMSLTDFRKAIKQDSRWQYTRNAQEEYASLTTKLMRMFGAGV